jgi:hypothetical protein
MIDFLKAHPGISRDEYLWEWTVPQVKLALYDNTHIEYLTERQAEIEKARRSGNIFDNATALMNDLGGVVLQ